MQLKAKSYSGRLEAPTKLKTCGVQIPHILICKILKEHFSPVFDDQWKKNWCGKTLPEYCLYITGLIKNGELSNTERERCYKLSRILKNGIRIMRDDLNRIESGENLESSPKELYYQILGLLRAIENLEKKEFKPLTRTTVISKKVTDIERELRFLKKIGALK